MPAIHPVVDEGLGNSAYVVELGDRRALVIDPARDPTPYLELARWRRLQIAYAAETHLHADFLTGSRDELEPVTREELTRRLQDGDDLVVLDVRPAAEYAAGHLPGAVSIPVGELRRRLAELPRDREIVAYCRGPYCAFAHEAVALLRREGFSARRLEDGLPEWQAAGLAVTGA